MGDDFVEPGSGTADTDTKPQTFGQAFKAARTAGDKTFMWRGKKYTTEMAGEAKPAAKAAAPAPAAQRVEVVGKRAKAEPTKADEDQYSGRARLTQRYGTAEARQNVKPDIKAEDIASAKKAGEERRARDRENLFTPLKNTMKRIGARVGSQETRERLKAEGYAKGGSVRGGGCEQRGKTRGKFV